MNNTPFSHRTKAVLIVDDDPMSRFGLTNIVRKVVGPNLLRNFKVFDAVNGKEALKILESEPISLVISDTNMNGWDGVDLLKAFKKKEYSAAFILLFSISYRHPLITKEDLFRMGADFVLTKDEFMDSYISICRQAIDLAEGFKKWRTKG